MRDIAENEDIYTERYKSLHIHTQRCACLKLCGSFKINYSKGEYAMDYDAVYNRTRTRFFNVNVYGD